MWAQLLLSSSAFAQVPSPGVFSVTREAGAESCPDTEALLAHVAELRGRPARGDAPSYRVTFQQLGGVFRARIRVAGGEGGAERELSDRGTSCTALEQATAVTLALLLDAGTEPARQPEPAAVPASPPPSEPAPDISAPAPRRAVALSLSVGAAGLLGVVGQAAPAALGDWGLAVGRFRTSVGVLWVPTRRLSLGPGQVHEALLGGAARTCVAPWMNERLRVDACSGIYAGITRARASGYTRNEEADEAWLAMPLELSVSTHPAPIGFELAASALFPIKRHDFAIDNLGVAHESWPVGLLVSGRVVSAWLL